MSRRAPPQALRRAIKAARAEPDEPPVRVRDDDDPCPWETPLPSGHRARRPSKPKSKGTRLRYTPPPWRGGPE